MLTHQLQRSLLKKSYMKKLTLGAALGVAMVIVVLSLFANYRRAAAIHLTGIHPHVSIRKQVIEDDDLSRIESALRDFRKGIVGFAPAIDLTMDVQVSQVDASSVVCAESDGQQRWFDFDHAGSMRGWSLRDATGFTIERSRTGPIRLRGIEIDAQGQTLIDVERVLDLRTAADDLLRLKPGDSERLPPAVLFERSFFHGAESLDDFLITLPSQVDERQSHVRLLSTINLGLKGAETPVVITSIEQARRLLGRPDFTNLIEVRLLQPEQAEEIGRHLEARLGPAGFLVGSWRDEDSGAFRLLGVLGRVLSLVLASVVLIAALSIASTLSLVVVERRRTIAMLRALGLRDRGIFVAVITGAVEIGGLGFTIGLALGGVSSSLLFEVPGFHSGLAKMGVQQPEVLMEPAQMVWLAVATMVLFVAAAWAPARAACRIDPVAGLTV